jgi:hypothetical protein
VRAELDDLMINGINGDSSVGRHLDTITERRPIHVKPGRVDYALAAVTRRRNWWRLHGSRFTLLTAAADRLLAMHVTTASAERNWSAWGRNFTAQRSAMAVKTGLKVIFVQVNNGTPHEGVDKELVLSLMHEAEEQAEETESDRE